MLDAGLGMGREREAQIAEVRAAVQSGVNDVKGGRVVEEAFAEICAIPDDMEAVRRV